MDATNIVFNVFTNKRRQVKLISKTDYYICLRCSWMVSSPAVIEGDRCSVSATIFCVTCTLN